MATIVKRQSRGRAVYQAKVRLAAGTTSATFDKLGDAKRWAASTEEQIRRGQYFEAEKSRTHTLKDAVTAYQQSPRFAKLGGQEVRKAHLKWWVEHYGDLSLARLTPDKLAEGRDKLRAQGKAPATCNRYVAALSACLSRTVRELGWIETNPVQRVDRYTEDNARERVLSDAEVQRLLDACRSEDLRDLIVLARYTAARRSELTGLRRQDVDLKRGMVRFLNTKNDDSRSVALVGPALAVMQRRLKVPRLDTDLVFPRARDPKQPADFREAFSNAVKRSGLGDDVVFHLLRHTALTRLAESGATLSELQQIAGHRTLAMVARYKHLTEDSTRSVMERMARGGRS
jgi:integrase